ncbi:unnamed protein product [Pipistrellus nathusii]|uniref:CCHC NOA-type domain-containing protein n=1 Tax=Pipistrellus nathusii TaxID=59473 RepID=A0ABN9ZAW2_PIPNA
MSSGDAGPGGREGAPRAAAALCGLYHEAGQQLRRLQEQLAARDALIERLRARLAALEGDAAPSLVDALLEQVARFREQLRRREGDAGAVEAALRQEVQRLSEQLAAKEAAQQRASPGPEREELAALRRRVAEKERARAASDTLCRSLADESRQLRRTLAATAHMCQHLARRLEAGQGAAGQQRPEPEHTGGDASVQAAVQKLQEENRLLKQKLTHVEDLNAKWQRYDASRDEYVQELRAQLRALQAPQAEAEAELMRKEIARLNGQLEERLGECAGAARELAAARERAQMLEQQILTYKDDFTSERADRERAQGRIQELEDQVAALQRQARRQGPPEAGSCWIHTASRAPRHAETKASEGAVPGGQRPVSASRGPAPGAGRGGQGDLQCPHCLQCFSDEQGEELFQHVAECCQ